MDLYKGNIRVSQVLSNSQARELLYKELPQIMRSPLLRMAQNMTLNRVINYARGKVPEEKIKNIIEKLKEI